ncbi:MAG: bifunctional phosphoribosyl-AMP cyclohydrolase/phosphoribosyl-ATP diphosphatase HisIE [Candidatus Paceibacterota bacterium]|jgi:phosphoribosyl-ATP pyrophosphohydrolase/phosphoribosyl-AMP cyclohydrolase
MKKINTKKINWEKVNGLIPAVIQDFSTGLVLMLGYMNQEALTKTMKNGFVWFYSRTRKKLWMKGETSGNTLKVLDIKLDCDNDTLLIKALPKGHVCHTGELTCFFETPTNNPIRDLFTTIISRKNKLPKGSYTTSLFKAGLDKISLKVAEESLEVVHAAQKQTQKRLVEEAVDLFYHLFVLLAEKEITLEQVESEIKKRQK